MLITSDLLATYPDQHHSQPLAGTGFTELDVLTGGFVPGRVWLLVAMPGQGRSTLVTQWATAIAAEAGAHTVRLATPRDGTSVVAGRLLSRIGRVPLPYLTDPRFEVIDEGRVSLAHDRLTAMNLSLFAQGEEVFVPEIHPLGSGEISAVLVDDADRVSGLTPSWVARCAAAGQFVLVSLPRHLVLMTSDRESDLDPTWAGVADAAMEIRTRGLTDGDLRPGEAELTLHYNRWGYLRTLPMEHQAHYSRFIEAPRRRPADR